jgi:hypothetical protein
MDETADDARRNSSPVKLLFLSRAVVTHPDVRVAVVSISLFVKPRFD